MYIATRHARLEAREAGFLVSINSKLAYMLKYAYMVPLAIKDSVSILRYLL